MQTRYCAANQQCTVSAPKMVWGEPILGTFCSRNCALFVTWTMTKLRFFPAGLGMLTSISQTRSWIAENGKTISAHLQKTIKTASVSTIVSWPSLINQLFHLRGPCGSSLLLRPPEKKSRLMVKEKGKSSGEINESEGAPQLFLKLGAPVVRGWPWSHRADVAARAGADEWVRRMIGADARCRLQCSNRMLLQRLITRAA